MPKVRPFRLSGGLFSAASAAEWADGARRLEDAGYDTLFTGDHFMPGFQSPLPALLTAALATSTLRVTCTVFDNDFRHPALLAKDVATVDLLTGGRFEFGVGAGWNKLEYESVGLAFDPPGVRLARLVEAVHVLKGLWKDGPFTFAGRHYAITEFDCQPKPLQRPHPPMFIGGNGERLLSFAAQEADIVGMLPRYRQDAELTQDTERWLAQATERVRQAAGDRFAELELAIHVWSVAITDDRRSAAERVATRHGAALSVDQLLESPFY